MIGRALQPVAEKPTRRSSPGLRVSSPLDHSEREADATATRILTMPGPVSQPAGLTATESHIQRCPGGCNCTEEIHRQPQEEEEEELQLRPDHTSPAGTVTTNDIGDLGTGQPLPKATRSFFEPRFGADLSQVRIHTNPRAGHLAHQVGAKAFTYHQNIAFAPGHYQPHTTTGKHLLAHELTHTIQQKQGKNRSLQRAVELRPPGRGEQSAFHRRQELVDRLNAVSIKDPALAAPITYRLGADGRTLLYNVTDEIRLDTFDRQMRSFIDATQVIPLRLITGAGLVRNAAGAFVPLLLDSFISGYLDLDDLLAGDDTSFKLVLSHLITERLRVPDYARRIGTNIGPLFNVAHRAGRAAETAVLQGILGDPSIRHNYDDPKPGGNTLVIAWRSTAERYHVFHIIRGMQRGSVSSREVRVRTADGRRVSIEAFIRERAAAAAP